MRMPSLPRPSPPTKSASPSLPALEERLQTRLRPPQDQRVHIVGALVGVDGLEVGGVTHDVILDLNAVAAVHVAGGAGDVERLAAIVPLDQRNHLRRDSALIEQTSDAQGALQAQRNLRLHVGQLFLYQLRGRQRSAELLALERVGPGALPAIFRRTHCAPGNTIACPIETAERSLQAR